MSKAQIRFSTNILSRLGEELTPSPDLGILELVKNSYDADALTCTVELINTDQPGGTILIYDNGDGMKDTDIRDGWLVLGKSRKDSRKLTRLDRIPAGNKGLGRLAALRMGHMVSLVTRPREATEFDQYRLDIDWDVYESAELVDEIALEILGEDLDYDHKPGTDIYITSLRQSVKRNDVKKLARGLILLADPFGDDPEGFQPILKAPEFADLEKLVQKRYLEDAEFHLISEVNKDGYVSAKAYDWRGELLYSASYEDILQRRRVLEREGSEEEKSKFDCPPAKFEAWIYLLDGETFSTRNSTLSEVRNWLKELGGIHVYQNGLRVSPYGNPGNDWVDMNLLRGRNPELRPGTNTSIGRVLVNDPEYTLIQKTDRVGFIETEKFQELKKFVQSSLEWLAIERINERDRKRVKQRVETPKKSTRSRQNVENTINQLPSGEQQTVREVFRTYDRAREKEVKQLKEEVQLYRTLSTAGITAATFAHESSGNPIKVITMTIQSVKRRAKKHLADQYQETLAEPIETIIKSVDSLAVLGTATLRLIAHEKRRVGRVDLHKVLNEVLKVFKPFTDGRMVFVETNLCPGEPYLRGSEAAIESIITNLLNNSLTALENVVDRERRILISTELTDNNRWVIRVMDNGPGIIDIPLREIWLPGQTTRQNGTGLGLTIVRDATADLGGEVDAIAIGELGGAELMVRLPILGV